MGEKLITMADSSNLNTSLSGYQNQDCQMILNDIPTALLVMAENRIIFGNAAAVRLLKARQSEDLTGKFLSDISPTTQPDGSSSAVVIQNLLSSVKREKTLGLSGYLPGSISQKYPER